MGAALKLPEPKWKREPSRARLAKDVLESTRASAREFTTTRCAGCV